MDFVTEAEISFVEALLAWHEIFSLFTAEERRRLLAGAHRESFTAGQVLFQKDDLGDFCLLVLSGCLRVSLGTEDGASMMLDIFGAGSILGEMALLDGGPRSADVEAEEDSVCLRIERTGFLAVLEENRAATLGLLRLLCGRLLRTTIQLEMIALQTLPARLARYLLELAEKNGEPAARGIRIRNKLKQSDLAAHLAASREAINKLLNAWQAANLISLLPRQVILLNDKEALDKIAGRSLTY